MKPSKIQRSMHPSILLSPLQCKSCGCDYLHQYQTEIFEREQDSDAGTRVLVYQPVYDENSPYFDDSEWIMRTTDTPNVIIDKKMSFNPSRRRHGSRIKFKCERCRHITVLHIYQHKGYSMVEIAQ